MPRYLLAIVFFASLLPAKGQDDLHHYLDTHHYSFSLDSGFTGAIADTLRSKLAGYRLILEAEGGSHYLSIYHKLELDWLLYLHRSMGLTHFVMEAGTSNAVLINKYLETGDSSAHLVRRTAFFDGLYRYNSGLPEDRRLKMTGIDFERASTYVRAIKLLLPAGNPPESIAPAIGLIRETPDSGNDCDAVLRLNKKLHESLKTNRAAFQDYLGSEFIEFDQIVNNNGSCKDPLRNRNDHMAENFLAFDARTNAPVYFGEFGEAHTVLKNRNLASIVNRTEPFKGKVAVINLYCQDCSTPEEPVSNWPLQSIEPAILRSFLPFCVGDFTLFDLSAPDPVIAPYREYGQFLIVARKQH